MTSYDWTNVWALAVMVSLFILGTYYGADRERRKGR